MGWVCDEKMKVVNEKMDMYDMVAISTHKNDERGSRKPHKMEV